MAEKEEDVKTEDVETTEEKKEVEEEDTREEITTCLLIKPHILSSNKQGKVGGDEKTGEDAEEGEDSAESKTDSTSVAEEVSAKLKAGGWTVSETRTVRLSRDEASEILSHSSENVDIERNIDALVSGPAIALKCSKKGQAIEEMIDLVGRNEDPEAERERLRKDAIDSSDWTLRALYGVDSIRNGFICSLDTFSAKREESILFKSKSERSVTCCVIKPDAMKAEKVTVSEGTKFVEREIRPWEDILTAIRGRGFVILAQREVVFTETDMNALYTESTDAQTFKEQLTPHMTNGKSLVLAIERDDAVRQLQLLMGPKDPEVARRVAPRSMRAQFGRGTVENAVVGSENDAAASRELLHWFPSGMPVEQTLAMIKPLATKNCLENILALVRREGFTIVEQQRVSMSRARAEAFYAEHKGRFFYENLTSYMSSGAVYAMVLAKPGAIAHWRQLLGPTNTLKARSEAPNSVRGLYGTDGTRNAAHGSDSTESAAREIRFFFPQVSRRHKCDATSALQYMTQAESSKRLNAAIIEGCVELCKVKPSGAEAIRWLGKWFLQRERRNVGNVASASSNSQSSSAATKTVESAPKTAQILADVSKSEVVFVLGGPGSGKTSLCRKIESAFGYQVLSSTELIDEEIRTKSALGAKIEAARATNDLLPNELIIRAFKNAMERAPTNRFVIDGYPLQLSQAFAFEQEICKGRAVIHLDATESCMKSRLKSSDDGEDGEDVVASQLAVYRDFCLPVIGLYKKLGRTRRIDADQDFESVWAQAATVFEKRVISVLGPPESHVESVCEQMSNNFGFARLQMSEVIAREVASGSRTGRRLDDMLTSGQLIPDDIKAELLREAISKCSSSTVVIQNYPRTMAETRAFEATIGTCSHVLNLNSSPTTRRQRLRNRLGTSIDSTARDVFKKDTRLYDTKTADVLAFYGQCGIVHSFDANGSASATFERVHSKLRPRVVVVMGAPGSKTSDFCARASRDFDMTHINVGALLRAEIARGSSIGRELDAIVRSGKSVPVENTVDLIRACIYSKSWCSSTFLIDGWPHTEEHVEVFESKVATISRVVYLRANADILRLRAKDMDDERFDRHMSQFESETTAVVKNFASRGVLDTITIGSEDDEDVIYGAFKQLVTQRIVVSASTSVKDWAGVEDETGFRCVSIDAVLTVVAQRGTAAGKLLKKNIESGTVSTSTKVAALRNVICGNGQRFLVTGLGEDAIKVLGNEVGASHVCSPDELRDMVRPNVTVLIGSEGSGCDEVIAYFGEESGHARFDVDALLEAEAETKTVSGRKIAMYLRQGRSVPTNLVTSLILREARRTGRKNIILTGYPRKCSETYPLVHDQAFALGDIANVKGVVVLECSRETKLRRCDGDVDRVDSSESIIKQELVPVVDFYGNRSADVSVLRVATDDVSSIRRQLSGLE